MEKPAKLLPPWEPLLLHGASVSAAATLICTVGLLALSQLILEPELACEHGRANQGQGQGQNPAWLFLNQNPSDRVLSLI